MLLAAVAATAAIVVFVGAVLHLTMVTRSEFARFAVGATVMTVETWPWLRYRRWVTLYRIVASVTMAPFPSSFASGASVFVVSIDHYTHGMELASEKVVEPPFQRFPDENQQSHHRHVVVVAVVVAGASRQ